MKKYISYISFPFKKIESESETLKGGDFRFPIISAMNPEEGEHISVVSLGSKDTNFDNIKEDVLKQGYTAGYTNIILDGDTESQMTGLFEYIVNSTNTDDELFIDISGSNRYITFAMVFAAKYINVLTAAKGINNIPTTIINTNGANVVKDVSEKYHSMDMMELVSALLKTNGMI